MTTSTTLSMRVVQARTLNPLIREFRLRADSGDTLPGFSAGSHIRVQVTLPDGSRDWRHYSLIDFSGAPEATAAPREYLIAVRKEDPGRGGSRFMHERLAEGDLLSMEPPANQFPVGAHAGAAVLVAGGIGITPLTAMAASRRAAQLPVRMVYAGRSRELMAYLPELQALLGSDLTVHADSEWGKPLDVDALLDSCGPADELYVCGPGVMLGAVQAAAERRGWPRERVHFEVFAPASQVAGDQAFEVVLSQSGKTLTVPADQTILQCLIDAGCDPLFDCQRGECGVCAVPVIEGDIDHRDHVLTQAEKSAGQVIQVCVSRAKGARLVLDL
jgi:vanillate O-demethylase ferredoxin subunit